MFILLVLTLAISLIAIGCPTPTPTTAPPYREERLILNVTNLYNECQKRAKVADRGW